MYDDHKYIDAEIKLFSKFFDVVDTYKNCAILVRRK